MWNLVTITKNKNKITLHLQNSAIQTKHRKKNAPESQQRSLITKLILDNHFLSKGWGRVVRHPHSCTPPWK